MSRGKWVRVTEELDPDVERWLDNSAEMFSTTMKKNRRHLARDVVELRERLIAEITGFIHEAEAAGRRHDEIEYVLLPTLIDISAFWITKCPGPKKAPVQILSAEASEQLARMVCF